MRTTLKRGIGQSAGLNGNGHSTLPPFLGPISRYRQPDAPRRSVIGRILRGFGWLVLAALVIASGAAGGIYLYGHESLNAVVATGKVKAAEVYVAKLPSTHDPAIALIAGYDHRAGLGSKSLAGSNSDTLMLVRADPINHTLSLLSFPRDLFVPIYCRGDVQYSSGDRINSAWSICPGGEGPSATLDTMEHLTHLPINYLITLDFHAFKQVVNRLHGVYMNVDRRYFIAKGTGTSAINLLPGYQKLDGGQALSFVRFRHFDNDIYRTGRQQQFIEALKARLRTSLSTSSLLTEVPALMGALKGNLQVAKAGGGAVTIKELESYLGVAYHLPPGHLFRNQIPYSSFHFFVTPGGADVESASQGAISAAVQSFLHPDVSESARVSAQLVGHPKPKKAPKQHPLKRAQISVLVLNANNVPGEATNTTYLLARRGFTTKALPASIPANAPTVQRDTTIYYDPVQPNSKQAAQQLQRLFGPHTHIAQMTPAIAFYATKSGNPLTIVAVGTSFGGKFVVHHRVKLPPKAPPQVSPGASLTVSALRGPARRLHFPVLAPYRVAQSAQVSTPDGIRVFRPLKGKHEVVLTFVQPDGIQHWQVEETDWTSPPILANPTGQFFFHHRKFLLYSTGGAIQMVAIRTPTAVYWVSNTILNQLSNSTMITIAKSLTPVGR
jgi:LCP family protein required for cell wall assembly